MGVGGERHVPAAVPPTERASILCIGGWVGPRAGLDAWGNISPPPGFDPRTDQPIASRYTDWAIAARRKRMEKGEKSNLFLFPNPWTWTSQTNWQTNAKNTFLWRVQRICQASRKRHRTLNATWNIEKKCLRNPKTEPYNYQLEIPDCLSSSIGCSRQHKADFPLQPRISKVCCRSGTSDVPCSSSTYFKLHRCCCKYFWTFYHRL